MPIGKAGYELEYPATTEQAQNIRACLEQEGEAHLVAGEHRIVVRVEDPSFVAFYLPVNDKEIRVSWRQGLYGYDFNVYAVVETAVNLLNKLLAGKSLMPV